MSKEKFFILKTPNGSVRLIGAPTSGAAKKFALKSGGGGVTVLPATDAQIVALVTPHSDIQVIDGAVEGKFFFVSGDGPDRIVRAKSARKVVKAIGSDVDLSKATPADLVQLLTSGVKVERAVPQATADGAISDDAAQSGEGQAEDVGSNVDVDASKEDVQE